MINLGVKIKNIRTWLKLSQGDFAKELNISRSGIAQIEANKTNPSFELINRIVKMYGVNPEFFFNNSNEFHTEGIVQKKEHYNVQKSEKEGLSRNDLNLLNKIGWTPDMEEIILYLSYSESRNKAILKDCKKELSEKIKTYNMLSEIADLLKINSFAEQENKFDKIDEKLYIKFTLQEYLPEENTDGLKFESQILKTIVQIISLKESINHLIYLICNKIFYLKRECSILIENKILTINEELLNGLKN